MAHFNTVLICPQHWGLGHVTRTIPIIRYFISKNCKIILASSGAGLELLKKEFPDLPLYEIPDYGINYPFKSMYLNIAYQFFKMNYAMIQEHFVLKRLCKEHHVDLLVSDSRLGAAQRKIPSVIIAHHLHFRLMFKFVEWICDTWMKLFYIQFDQLWVPDVQGSQNLSGDLAHLYRSRKHFFIGILSRFQKLNIPIKYDYCFMLSGPEPQRTYLEEIILKQVENLKPSKCILIRGTSKGINIDAYALNYQSFLEIKNLVTGHELNAIMCASEFIICRSGYSTLLDLAIIQKPALLIPTPGQPEQEYLADQLMESGLFYTVNQDAFQLETDLHKAIQFKGYVPISGTLNLEERLDELLLKLKQKFPDR
ncbi:MAG: glycosyltransferase [Saprospiraceae bacterium]|nr:glycosyltransferase [Saprospiraceae bacterium]